MRYKREDIVKISRYMKREDRVKIRRYEKK